MISFHTILCVSCSNSYHVTIRHCYMEYCVCPAYIHHTVQYASLSVVWETVLHVFPEEEECQPSLPPSLLRLWRLGAMSPPVCSLFSSLLQSWSLLFLTCVNVLFEPHLFLNSRVPKSIHNTQGKDSLFYPPLTPPPLAPRPSGWMKGWMEGWKEGRSGGEDVMYHP